MSTEQTIEEKPKVALPAWVIKPADFYKQMYSELGVISNFNNIVTEEYYDYNLTLEELEAFKYKPFYTITNDEIISYFASNANFNLIMQDLEQVKFPTIDMSFMSVLEESNIYLGGMSWEDVLKEKDEIVRIGESVNETTKIMGAIYTSYYMYVYALLCLQDFKTKSNESDNKFTPTTSQQLINTENLPMLDELRPEDFIFHIYFLCLTGELFKEGNNTGEIKINANLASFLEATRLKIKDSIVTCPIQFITI